MLRDTSISDSHPSEWASVNHHRPVVPKRRFTARTRSTLAVVISLGIGLASCKKKTDEQRLRAQIDCTSVHLYVASKIALTGDQSNEQVRTTRRLLSTAAQTSLRVLDSTLRTINHQAVSERTGSEATLRPQDLAALVIALWQLRAQGAQLVRSGNDEQIPSVLAALMRDTHADVPPEMQQYFNASSEHALFFMLLLAMRFDSRVPIPVPPEVLLYEASRTDPERANILGFEGLLHGAKAYVYGTNDLCDLSASETHALESSIDRSAQAAQTLRNLSHGRVQLVPSETRSVNASARVLAHGAGAMCFAKRGDTAKSLVELGCTLNALNDLGVSSDETATLRALIAYEQGHTAEARAALAQARGSTTIDSTTRSKIEALDRAIASNDRRAVRRVMNDTAIAEILARLLYHRLERAGVLEQLRQTAVFRELDGYLRAASSTVHQARSRF
jgi:hypothetical protein